MNWKGSSALPSGCETLCGRHSRPLRAGCWRQIQPARRQTSDQPTAGSRSGGAPASAHQVHLCRLCRRATLRQAEGPHHSCARQDSRSKPGTHGLAVRPTAVVDARVTAFRHDPAVGPEGELHAARDSRALDCRNDGLAERPQARWPQGPRGTGPPSVGNSSDRWVWRFSGVAMRRFATLFRSAPAQNAPPSPQRTATSAASSVSKATNTACNS